MLIVNLCVFVAGDNRTQDHLITSPYPPTQSYTIPPTIPVIFVEESFDKLKLLKFYVRFIMLRDKLNNFVLINDNV